MAGDRHPVLVVASAREDRRVLFDALNGAGPGEILSARDAIHARALLRRATRPVLAILDFEHAPTQSRMLCSELGEVPVIGLFGANFDLRLASERPAEYRNVKAWLRVPVDATEASVRIRETLRGPVAPALPEVNPTAEPPVSPAPVVDQAGILRRVAELLRPANDAAGLPGLVQRAMDVLGMDMMAIAGRDATGDTLESLARVDRVSAPGGPDPLRQVFVQQALDGETCVRAGIPKAELPDDAFASDLGCSRYAALPLFDAHRNVLGVMVCASRRTDAIDQQALQPLLEIVATRFASLLELRIERERGRSRALLDGLTGLPNRVLFNDRLDSTIHDARRTGELFAVLFVDLDHFKGINDSLGHGVGDQVLIAQGRRLRGLVRASDTVARYAGDEFTLILRHVNDRADLARIAAKLLKGMQAPLTLEDGSELHVTASIGISVYPDDGVDSEGLVKHADMAMYSAKGRGRNNIQAFGNVPEDAHRQRLEMESRLRGAETNGELSVHYQPQIDLESEDIVGVEALVRWRHPVLGMLSPAFFVPLAEETGLIIPIGEWVLRHACTDVAVWQRRTGVPLRLAVNLSALQWMQPNLVGMIEAACREARLDPHMLDLETAEGVLANPQQELAATLRAVRRIGCRVVIDDAGAGHALAEHATRLPMDAVKIDQCFVRNIGNDPDDEATVTSILEGARGQGVHAIAEGVETERQLAFLRERGCETAQGYLFCHPLTAGAFTNLLAARHAAQGRGDSAGSPVQRPDAAAAGAGGARPVPPDFRRGATG